MKNKHLLFAVTLVLTAGLTGFSQTAGRGQVELTSDSGKKALNLESQNPKSFLSARRVNQFSGTIDIADVVRAQEQVRALNQKGTNSFNIAWDELGPNNVGGRTRALMIDKDDPTLIIAGSVGGGIWKSTTRGTSWTQSVTTDGGLFQNQVISCITQATNGDIYVGTGEGFANVDGMPDDQYFGSSGQGVYKSTDRGNTFSRLGSTWNNEASMDAFFYVNAIAADPTNAERVYAATRKGLRVSTDGGANWNNPIAGLDSVAQDVAIAVDGTVFASIDNIAYVSTDGATFTKISAVDGVDTGMINESASITRLKFATSPSDANYVYCAVVGILVGKNISSQLENIYQSKDKGATWSVIGPGGASSFQPFSSAGNYNLAMAVSPDDPGFIMVGGFNLFSWSYDTGWERITIDEPYEIPFSGFYVHRNQHTFAWSTDNPKIIYAGTNGGVTVTTNRGNNWSTVNKNLNITQMLSIAFSNKGEVLGGSLDNGTLFIDYQGNDPMYADWWGAGGFLTSFLSYRHGGDVAISMIDPNIQFFTTSGGTVHKRLITEGQPTTRTNYWPRANGGAFISPMALWESWDDPHSWDSIMFIADRDYAAGETLIVESALGKRPLRQVLDSPLVVGDTMKIQDTYQSMIAVGKNDGAGVKVNRGAVNPSSEGALQRWYGIIDRKLLEDKKGESNTGNQVVEVEYSHDGNHLYSAVYIKDDAVYKIFRISNLENARDRKSMDTDTGFDPQTGERLYVQTTTEIGQFSQIPTDITVHPGNPDVVLVTLGNYGNDNYLYLATAATSAADSSNAFVSVQGNLPQAPAYSVIFNARDPKEVIVGTEYGVYSTTDIFAGTPTWSSENGNGMDIVPVMGMKQQHLDNNAERGIENHGVIYAATFGRGFFKSETFGTKGSTGTSLVVNNTTNIEVSIMPNPVADYAQVSYKMAADGDVSFEIYDLSGKVVKFMELNGQAAGEHQISIDASELDAGTYLMRMNANNQRTSMKFMIK